MENLMKAFVLDGFDQQPQLREVARPIPAPNELLVRVRSTSVNPVDVMVRTGFFRAMQEYRFPAVFGRDVAGTVDAVGSDVTRYRAGDTVYGFVKRDHIGDGTFAEYVVVPEDHFVSGAPSRLSLDDAGVLGLSGITALECVDAAPAAGDDIVVINGATGGLGSFAVQIALARGAEVIATARTPEQMKMLAELGVTQTVDWTAGDLVEQVREIVPAGATGFLDFVKHVDSQIMGVGEDDAHAEFARLSRGVLRSGGRAVSVTNGGDPALMGDIAFANVHSTPSPGSLKRLAALVGDGSVTPVIAATFPFDDIESAFGALAAHPIGKIAVTIEALS
jgi:NADPH:quinone reductase-like Zn-dependent oxidoreductase